MKCPQCQAENPEAKKFCRECGARLSVNCPQCGADLLPDDRFCGECGQRLGRLAETQETALVVEGERKHATVLFSDLSGYTAMTERLDPEEVKAIMSHIFGEIAQVVTKYEGLVERFFGDEVMALFGVPKAHEDDPVRAIRAAREIHDVVKDMSPQFEKRIGQPLAMHTGINTGLVITGDEYIGKGRHGLTGDTVNLAARLTKLAQPGEILVGPDTYSQAEGYFAFESLEPTQVKGKEEAVRVYRALSPKEQPTKIHRSHGVRADLIGRRAEMDQLGEAVKRLREGEGSIVSISGDAGTGKSRLIEEFKATLDLEQIQWREGHAYAYSQNIPFFPIVDMMSRAWQIEEGDPLETVKKKVESNIENLIGRKEDVAPYIGSLYALSYPEIESVDPEFWRRQLYRAMQKILSALVQRAPTVICLEDLHWADRSSLDLLRFILSEFSHPAVFIFVYRPYFSLFTSDRPSTAGKSLQEIRLKDLSPADAQEMTASLLKTETVPGELQDFVEQRVEGNPFFLEEVINSLIETETLVHDNGNWRLTKSLSEAGISPTIHGVISGRLDRLEKESKRILQEASVIGRAFFYEILKRVTELKQDIDQCLFGLEGLDLIRIKSLQPDLEYIFKHALTQEVVYEGLLKKERQTIHERIGIVMEQLFHDRLPEFYETLAFHFKQGTSILKAVEYLMKSGEKSFRRYAVEESHEYYKDGFDLLAKKPDRSREEDCLLIDLIGKWALIYTYYGDFKAELELLKAYQNLAESLDDKGRLGMFYVCLASAFHYRDKKKDAYHYLHRALKLGEETESQQLVCHACSWLTWVCADMGLLDEATSFGKRAQEIAMRLPPDPILQYVSLSGLGYTNWHKGRTKKVFEYGKKLLDHGKKNSDMRSMLWGWWILGFGYFTDGNLQSAVDCFKEALQVSRDPFYPQIVRVGLGAMYASAGQFQEAEEVLQDVVIYGQEHGSETTGTPAKMYLGAVLIGKGRMGQGLRMIEEVQRWNLENGKKSLYAVSECVLGKIYLQIAERTAPMTLSTIAKNIGFLVKNVPFASKKAQYHFNKAIEVAKEIGAKGTLGQAYLDLGLLHKAKGRKETAAECLANAVRLFEEGGAEGYLQQAKEALASLG